MRSTGKRWEILQIGAGHSRDVEIAMGIWYPVDGRVFTLSYPESHSSALASTAIGIIRYVAYGILYCYGVTCYGMASVNCKILSYSIKSECKMQNEPKKSLFISYFLFVDNLTQHVVYPVKCVRIEFIVVVVVVVVVDEGEKR